MNKRVSMLLAAVAVVLVVGFVFLRSPRPATETKPVAAAITIAQAGDFYLYAPLYVAADRGLFKQHGLDVTIVSTGGDEKTWAAVIGGSAQFGVADPTFIAIASQRGQPGKIVATIVNGVPFWGITKNPQVPVVKSAADLKGFTVATFPAPSTAYTLQRRMFDQAKVPPAIREGGFGTLLSLVESSQADIALELEPNVSQALTRGYRIVYSLADIYGDFTITGLTASPDYISGNPAVVRGVVAALSDAMKYLHANPDEAATLLAKRFPEINRDVAAAALKRVLAAGIIPLSPKVDRAAWEKALQLRIEAGDVKQPADAMQFVDNSFSGN
jgi:NitT/TauT family transport system substrate-binding protein